ncbi:MAG: BREX system P-loop protein BrxC [Lachnospiraceae bacterium]|nr:BREX system P-loop protein BrxC [Lachnospiraceae bacterium]
MKIQQMFYDDIDRKINGVVKVDQDTADVLKQEVKEYVITRDVRKHMISFFNHYGESFREPTADVGVWISGFFGSGKSHFLKMLSYLLENQEVDGKKVEDYFREKFDDEATFMPIASAIRGETQTILFNIDIEGSINKDKTAVLRVFAKMFYNYLGFYGENLKCAKMEQFIDKQGKTEEFRRVFEEKNGSPWVESRDAFAFFEDDVVETLMQVLGMSETAAHNWFDGTETIETSIAQLVSEMKEYVDKKPADFRLLFMIDEVGQYVGDSIDLLMNLQSLVEKIGSECNGKIWVVCTGQEAIDEIIKTRQDQFSRIQARFKTRLSLTSSSADEVIQKRILRKKEDVTTQLEQVYNENDSVLRNLFSFTDAILDIKGYNSPGEFVKNFPFVPYQFIIMQKVFSEIRKHGNSGKHLSGGERSMLSGFQEAAQKIEDKDEFALAPFYLFYDTVHTFLDSSIRRVIERCQKAADSNAGIEQQDVSVLKLLYLVRYIDDIKANLDNIVILMADDIRMDKIIMREQVRGSLDRLMSQNYIGRTGDTYNFLTDEEQDIQREIRNTPVDTAAIVERIAHTVFGDIYTTKKYRYGKYDFAFDQMVDNTTVGAVTGGMRLKILTVATDQTEKAELRLMSESAGQAIVVLADTPYYESLENAMKIRKYVKQRNVAQLPKSVRDIIGNYQGEADKYEQTAQTDLAKAISEAEFYVDGEKIEVKAGAVSSKEEDPAKREYEIQKGKAKNVIDQSLEYLVSHVYSDLALIRENAESDADILALLTGAVNMIPGTEPNRDAAAKVEEYLEMQDRKHLPTSMADVQSRYQAIPYGWREIDIAAVVALLVVGQKVTIKYAGSTVQPNNPKLPDMLRKKSEIGKTQISKRQVVSASRMKAVKDLLRDYFNLMDVPADEDGLIRFIIDKFEGLQKHYEDLLAKYEGHKYPDKSVVTAAVQVVKDVLSQQKDNMALIERVLQREDNLYDAQEAMQNVEAFFKTQVSVFDAAVKFESDLRNDRDYIKKDEEANTALNTLRLITMIPQTGKYDYKRIPELNGLMTKVKTSHDAMLEEKRIELLEVVRQCMADIHIVAADGNNQSKAISDKADTYYTQQKEKIAETTSLALMEGFPIPMWNYRDDAVSKIDFTKQPPKPVDPPETDNPVKPEVKKTYKPIFRQSLLKSATLESDAEIDAYVDKLRDQLKTLLKGSDGIELK